MHADREKGEAICKHGLNPMDSIKSAFAGQPIDFAPE
jgi:hypothetical protein